MAHFQPGQTCRNLCALRSRRAADSVAAVADRIGTIALRSGHLQAMNETTFVLEATLEGRAASGIIRWILEILTALMTTVTGAMMIGGHSGNETIPISNANNKPGPTPVHRMNLESDPQAIPYPQRPRVNDRRQANPCFPNACRLETSEEKLIQHDAPPPSRTRALRTRRDVMSSSRNS